MAAVRRTAAEGGQPGATSKDLDAMEAGLAAGPTNGTGAAAAVQQAHAGDAAAAGAGGIRMWWRRLGIRVMSEREIRWHVRLEAALLRKYWYWLVLAVLAEYTHLVAHNLVYYMEGYYYGPEGPPPPLKDLGLMLLGDRVPSNYEWIVGAATCTLVALVLGLALGRVTLKHVPWGGPQLEVVARDHRTGQPVRSTMAVPLAMVLRRTCQALSLALILRVITFLVTMLPNPAEYCHGEFWNPPKSVGEIFTRWAVEGSCGDLLYSGHTAHGMILMLIVLRYAPNLLPARVLAIGVMTLLAVALLVFKSHYTSDVVVAVYVTIMIWRLMPAEPTRLESDALRISTACVVPDTADAGANERRPGSPDSVCSFVSAEPTGEQQQGAGAAAAAAAAASEEGRAAKPPPSSSS